MNMYCIKVCKEKKITYLSFARSTYHNQDCKTNDTPKINVVHRMCPNEILQKNHVINPFMFFKKAILYQITRDVYQRGI